MSYLLSRYFGPLYQIYQGADKDSGSLPVIIIMNFLNSSEGKEAVWYWMWPDINGDIELHRMSFLRLWQASEALGP